MGLRAPQAPGVAQPKAPLPEFAQQRQKVEQRVNADTQGQQDAMQRRFAAQGMLNSGAAIKQGNIVANQGTQNKVDAIAGVDAAEMGEQQRRQEIQDTRDFSANQAQLGRDFEGQQSQLGRDFAGNESKLGRDLQSSQFNKSYDMQNSQFKDTFGLQKSQFNQDVADNAFNRRMATYDLNDEERAYVNNTPYTAKPKSTFSLQGQPIAGRRMNSTGFGGY